ncbi:MAG: MFS transporter [Candidatus Eisenbacteria bacterium]|nr:MFS transporter [Candidatus Eisenbacteria bacterium]
MSLRFNRAAVVDENFVESVKNWSGPDHLPRDLDQPIYPPLEMTGREMLDLLQSQMISRHLDLIAREMRTTGSSFYTIGSSGHEGNAVVSHFLRDTDPAFLHYRSGGFVVHRLRREPNADPIYDTILSKAASSEDPVSGGRHKVWGSKKHWILPQTSTIASHLPKAVGCAIAIARAKRIGRELPVPRDAIVVCSFGDASTNHSTALGAFNVAAWTAYQNLPVPILFVCEDNGIGISTRSPSGYLEREYLSHPGIKYFRADGLHMREAYRDISDAVNYCREKRVPVFLHLKVVRLLGHAGSDFELEYRSIDEIEATEAQDPVLASARLCLETGVIGKNELLDRYERIRQRCRASAEHVVTRPRLMSAAEVVAPLAPYTPDEVRKEATRDNYLERRLEKYGPQDKFPENGPPRHMAALINQGLFEIMTKYQEALIFGQDVAKKGGVYNVTKDLTKAFRSGRVFNSPLDETSILGLAQGAGYMNLLPLPEIQYLAYFHNACDQIRGEACSLQFFSKAQYQNPMVLRIASLGYQKGFGGHFHNDNSTTALRDIPGLVIACPSRGDDAAVMLRTCTALAKVDGRVVVFLEPIALYMTKDLHTDKDGEWSFQMPPLSEYVAPGSGRVYDESHSDIAILTYGNGVYFSLRVARRLLESEGIRCRVFDLRWLAPLDVEGMARHARECGRVLIVDEGRRSGGVSEAMITALVEQGLGGLPIRRVVGEDTYIPLGPAANLVLPSEEQIDVAVRELAAL